LHIHQHGIQLARCLPIRSDNQDSTVKDLFHSQHTCATSNPDFRATTALVYQVFHYANLGPFLLVNQPPTTSLSSPDRGFCSTCPTSIITLRHDMQVAQYDRSKCHNAQPLLDTMVTLKESYSNQDTVLQLENNRTLLLESGITHKPSPKNSTHGLHSLTPLLPPTTTAKHTPLPTASTRSQSPDSPALTSNNLILVDLLRSTESTPRSRRSRALTMKFSLAGTSGGKRVSLHSTSSVLRR